MTTSRFRSPFLVSLLTLATTLQGCASTSHTHEADAASLIAELTRQADEWDKAIVRKDRPAIAGNMTGDFRQIRSNGDLVDGETFLRDLTSADLVIDPYTVEDFDVRVYGNVALLSGRTQMTGHFAGTPFTTHYRYIDVYVLENGEWRVCSVQTTKLSN